MAHGGSLWHAFVGTVLAVERVIADGITRRIVQRARRARHGPQVRQAWSLALFVALACSNPVFAAVTDCIGESTDGLAVCVAPDPDPWTYSLCDEAAPFSSRYAAWCKARGGTYNGVFAAEECSGATTPITESTLFSLSVAFGTNLYDPGSCGGSDTGWGITVASNYCAPGGTVTQSGFVVSEHRRFPLSCTTSSGQSVGETVSAARGRKLACPPNTTSRTVNGELVCAKPICDCNNKGVGNPIVPATGDKVQSEDDGVFDGWPLSRHYRSTGPVYARGSTLKLESLGVRWVDAFHYRVQPMTGSTSVVAALSTPEGAIQYFRADGSAVLATEAAAYQFATTDTGYDVRGNGVLFRFDAAGKLVRLVTSSARIFSLTYSDGTTTGPQGQVAVTSDGVQWGGAVPANQLIRVESDTGRILRFARDGAGKITQMQIGSGEPTRYFYSDDDLLTKVVYPGGQARLYHYNEPAQTDGANLPYMLTGISDVAASGMPVRYASFAYNTSGLAIATEHAGGADRHDLQFASDGLQVTVTDPLGTQRVMTYAAIQGVRKLVSVSQPAGTGSAAAARSMTYDADGNQFSSDDYNGNRTCKFFDASRKLEVLRVEGLADGQACSAVSSAGAALPAGSRKVSKEWHPQWPIAIRVAEPKKMTTRVYNGQPDPFNGNAVANCAPASPLLGVVQPVALECRRVEQATTDANGSQGFAASIDGSVAARENKWTYDERGQILTHDGPRTDLNDVTTYAYYSDTTADHTLGDLQSVRNPAGHLTQYTMYDAEGRVKRWIAANGVVTDVAYTPRGWISSTAVSAGGIPVQTTTYSYEPDGKVATVTLPDATTLTYSYDEARRLNGITDAAGNSVTYVLDNAGNRLSEQYRDPGGVLTREIRRVYDALGRLSESTGAMR